MAFMIFFSGDDGVGAYNLAACWHVCNVHEEKLVFSMLIYILLHE